jgi:hypothetical protein
MNATEILWGQVLLVAAVGLGFVWAATEWTAWKLGFQSQLRPPGSVCSADRSLCAYRLLNITIGWSIAYLPNACAICPTSLAQGMSIAA